MKIYKFDNNIIIDNAPAYSCSEPGDNTGYYVKVTDIQQYWMDGLRQGLSIDEIIKNLQTEFIKYMEEIFKSINNQDVEKS